MKKDKLSYKKKAIILFIEYFIFAIFSQIIFELLELLIDNKNYNSWLIRLILFFLYFNLSELIFSRSLGMSLFKIENSNQGKLNINFIIYSLTSILDRILFVPFHILLAFMNYENPLLCEKLSGINWRYSELKY